MLAVSDGGSAIRRREHGGQWQRFYNGSEGLLFFTDTQAIAWEPEFSRNHAVNLRWFFEQFPFSDRGKLFREAQLLLFTVNLFHLFFPAFRRTRMIPAFLGVQGSGKTTAMRLIGRLFAGTRFEVSDVPRQADGFTVLRVGWSTAL